MCTDISPLNPPPMPQGWGGERWGVVAKPPPRGHFNLSNPHPIHTSPLVGGGGGGGGGYIMIRRCIMHNE